MVVEKGLRVLQGQRDLLYRSCEGVELDVSLALFLSLSLSRSLLVSSIELTCGCGIILQNRRFRHRLLNLPSPLRGFLSRPSEGRGDDLVGGGHRSEVCAEVSLEPLSQSPSSASLPFS